jgi:hypothetical protein
MPTEGILAGLVNLGLGGIMTAALVWFLHQLVARTLPDMPRALCEEARTAQPWSGSWGACPRTCRRPRRASRVRNERDIRRNEGKHP